MHLNKKYLTIIGFAQYSGVTPKTVQRWITQGKITTIKAKAKSKYRKSQGYIHYKKLTKEAQDAFLRDADLLPSEDKKTPDGEEKRIFIDLTEKQKAKFANKEATQKEIVQVLAEAPWGKKGIIINEIAQSFGTSVETIYRDLRKVKQEGRDALIPDWHGGQRTKVINNEIAKIIDDLYLTNSGPSIKEVCEILRKSHNIEIPYPTVHRYINTKYTPGQKMLFRDREEWNRKFSPYIRRDWSKVALNECWIGDQKQLDIPWLFRKKVTFPWLTIFMDMKSRCYLSWILTEVPTSGAVAQAFVYAVRKFGAPVTVYLDRGKQYTAKVIAGGKIRIGKVVRLFEDIEATIIPGIFAELGSEIFWAAPYNAREKPIEPSFRVFNRLRHVFPRLYRGPYTRKRPKDYTKYLKSEKIPNSEEMAQKVGKEFDDYNERKHSETGKKPNSFFVNFNPIIPSEKLLAFLLLAENRVHVRDSTVTIEGFVYRHDELWKLAGELVEVRRDPQNIQKAAIIYQNKVFCFASLEVPDHYRSPKTLEAVKTTRRIRRKVSKWRKSVIEHEGAIEDPLTYAADLEEMEIMRSRDIQPADTKITQIHQREKLARETIAGIQREDEEVEEMEKKAAVGRLTLEDLIPPPDPEPEKRPGIRLLDDEDLSIFHESDDFFDE